MYEPLIPRSHPHTEPLMAILDERTGAAFRYTEMLGHVCGGHQAE